MSHDVTMPSPDGYGGDYTDARFDTCGPAGTATFGGTFAAAPRFPAAAAGSIFTLPIGFGDRPA